MLRDSLKWRVENKIDNIRCDEVESQIVMGRIFFKSDILTHILVSFLPCLNIPPDMYNFGRDKFGRPVVVLRVHTERDPHDENQKLRFMIYSMERSIRYYKTANIFRV
jgi:hypothetical protein